MASAAIAVANGATKSEHATAIIRSCHPECGATTKDQNSLSADQLVQIEVQSGQQTFQW